MNIKIGNMPVVNQRLRKHYIMSERLLTQKHMR